MNPHSLLFGPFLLVKHHWADGLKSTARASHRVIRRLALLATLGLLLLSAEHSHGASGPLGLRKGMSLTLLQQMIVLEPSGRPHWYSAKKVPMGHPMFGRYDFLVDPALGLCKVVATGNTVHTDAHGSALMAAFRELREGLISKYGRPTKDFNFARGGDLLPRSARWMSGLLEGERHLSSFWTKELGAHELQAIQLEARALSQFSGWVFLIYEFDGADACAESQQKRRAKSV